ncbi:MAG: hypothetical protein LUF92_00835 [Clostridiales bacterium]|nr:hypothetical protein [Clostridiales bacterium]
MNKLKRIAALLLVMLLIGLVILTLYFAITGSPYFMASLVAMLVVPVLLYAYMFIYRLLKGGENEDGSHKDRIKKQDQDKL